jgi:hypothetical protein
MVKLSPESGLTVRDGTVVVGQNTSDAVFTTPEDMGLAYIFDAERIVRKLNKENAYGHNDWRLPNDDEKVTLLSLADKHGLKTTFNVFKLGNPLRGQDNNPDDRSLSSCYLSSDDLTRFSKEPAPKNEAMQLETNDGAQLLANKKSRVQFFIRPVRNGPMPV